MKVVEAEKRSCTTVESCGSQKEVMEVVEILRKLWKPKRSHGSCGNYEEVVEAKNRK